MNVLSRTLSDRAGRLLFWASAGVLAVGTLVFLVVFFRSPEPTGALPAAPKAGDQAKIPAQAQKARQLDPAVREVAGKFILTAVARRNLDQAWKLTHPSLKQGFTLATWRSGELPVTPFPVSSLSEARFRVDEVYENQVTLEVALIPKAGAAKATPAQTFFIGLKAVGKGADRQWLVDYWMPRYNPPVRDAE